MRIRRTTIPSRALISNYLPANYTDVFECLISHGKKITADDLMITFWTNSPGWVNRLFRLRDWIVKPFGIRPGGNASKEKLEDAIKNGGYYGFVSVVAKSDTETVISADDKHLKMYFSISTENPVTGQQKLTVTTVVHFHNWLGYVYFYAIYPFHQLIVPSMIKHTVKKILKS